MSRAYFVVRNQCFSFLHATNISGFSGYQSIFPGLLSYSGSPGVFILVVIHAQPKALSCDLPTRDRISSRPRRNMACGKWHSQQNTPYGNGSRWLQAREIPGTPLTVGDGSDLSNQEYNGIVPSQLPAASRVDIRRTVLDRDVVCKALLR